MINNLLLYLYLYIVQILNNDYQTENDMSTLKLLTIIANTNQINMTNKNQTKKTKMN